MPDPEGRDTAPCGQEGHYFVDSATGECVECRQDAAEGRETTCAHERLYPDGRCKDCGVTAWMGWRCQSNGGKGECVITASAAWDQSFEARNDYWKAVARAVGIDERIDLVYRWNDTTPTADVLNTLRSL